MSTVNMNNNIKELFPNHMILIKIGAFVETYNNDAKILGYLLNYKIKNINANQIICGFPKSSINKIISLLETYKISYKLLDKANNYYEESKMDFKKNNKYDEIFVKADNQYSINLRINHIVSFLKTHKEKIKEVENIIYE